MTDTGNRTLCTICGDHCGLLARDDGQHLHIRGNPDHPLSRGYACFRGKNYGEVHYSPERLTSPLLKKSGRFVPVSWPEALEIMAEHFTRIKAESGPESVAFFKGEALKHQESTLYMRHLAYGFGSPNLRVISYTAI